MMEADGLGHDDLAASIAGNIDALPVGSVIAIQAAWGRGKTDVLMRVESLFQERAEADSAVRPLWINPWQYGTPNLIAPLVTELLQRLEPEQRAGNPRLREAAETLLRAGNAVAFKALSVFVPFGELLSGGQGPVDDLIRQLFASDAAPALLDADPIAAMARRFCDLIDEYLNITGSSGPVIICVDDLDRCLPDQQIAMLEAVHFLTGAGAEANFVVAIDPRLVQQAAVSHYSGSAFDVEQYLNKLFDLRVNLTALAGDLRRNFIASALRKTDTGGAVAAARLGLEEDELARIWNETFYLPELSNPRLISRAVRRLDLYLAHDPDPLDIPGLGGNSTLTPSQRVALLVRLIAIAERWPDLRLLVQAIDPSVLRDRLEKFSRFYGLGSESPSPKATASLKSEIAESPWLFDRLPDRKFHPDLGLFLDNMLELPELDKAIEGLDRKLMAAGL
jgi:hypothetical protein